MPKREFIVSKPGVCYGKVRKKERKKNISLICLCCVMQYGMTLIINDIFIIPAQNMKLHVYCTAYVYHVTFTSAYPMQISAFGWLRKSFVCSRRPYLTSNPTGILRKYQILHAKRVMHVRYLIVKSLHHAFEKNRTRKRTRACG